MEVLIETSLINGPCSIAMFDYRRVFHLISPQFSPSYLKRWDAPCRCGACGMQGSSGQPWTMLINVHNISQYISPCIILVTSTVLQKINSYWNGKEYGYGMQLGIWKLDSNKCVIQVAKSVAVALYLGIPATTLILHLAWHFPRWESGPQKL